MKNENMALLRKILSDRCHYYFARGDAGLGSFYENVLCMLDYALDDDTEALKQFDYFPQV